jgi:hypothetical protein
VNQSRASRQTGPQATRCAPSAVLVRAARAFRSSTTRCAWERYTPVMKSADYKVVVLVLFLLTACSGGGTPPASEPAQISAPPDVAAAPADAIRTSSNLASRILKPGTGTRHPRPNSMVTVNYTGWTTDGKMFDSSVAKGQPLQIGLDGVIPGWTEGVQMMVEGEKRRFWIPSQLAYDGQPGMPQGTLVFDIELIRIDS